MVKYPYTNTSHSPVYLGGRCVPAGETRTIEAPCSRPEEAPSRPAANPAQESDPLKDLLSARVQEIVKALPGLSHADFKRLIWLEESGPKPRISLIKAIAEEELRRASIGQADPLSRDGSA